MMEKDYGRLPSGTGLSPTVEPIFVVSTASPLQSLAQRCEAATGPDRELDVLIEIECGSDGWRIKTIMAGSPHNTISDVAKHADRDAQGLFFRVPTYTASLDAAMTLVPEGWLWMMSGGGGCRCTADLCLTGKTEDGLLGEATTPALALCAAALRARDSDTQPKAGDAQQGSARE